MVGTLLTSAALAGVAVACIAIYLVPVLIGWARSVPDIGSVAVINILLGWTAVGWVAALAMALRTVNPAPPLVQVVQNSPSVPPQHPLPPPPGWMGPPGPPSLREDPPPLNLPRRPPGIADPREER
jgi:hypothetical protein